MKNAKLASEEIERLIASVIRKLGFPDVKFTVEHPAEENHGDYATNVALVAGKQTGKDPRELAEKITEELKRGLPEFLSKVEVAGPGFINFWLSEHFLLREVERVLQEGSHYAKATRDAKRKIMVEYTDPNPFKEFHIGHLYSNIVGEALCRLWEFSGAEVKRVNYQGDVGMHVAKSLWALLRMKNGKLKMQHLEEKPLEERVKILGEAYAEGARAYEDPPVGREQAKKEIEKINKQIYERDPEIEELYQKGRQWSLDYFEKIYQRLGTKFDFYYFEREAGELGAKLVREWLKRGLFDESQGAVIFPGEKYGLHTRVFINSLGLPTYEAKELGLVPRKYKDFAYDESVIVTANEINEYFKVLLAALRKINPELASKHKHIGHGIVKLPEGKMSSRTGNILTGEWLLDEAKRRVLEIMKEPDGEIAEVVGQGAVKYALLKNSIGQDVVFDFDKSVSLEGNSGPYLQYTYARCRSVMRKANFQFSISNFQSISNLQLNNEERAILRWIYRFPEVVAEAAQRYEPSQICTYLFDLASRFNAFYNKHSILGISNLADEDTKAFRLLLTGGVGQIMKNGLWLLGIGAPEKM